MMRKLLVCIPFVVSGYLSWSQGILQGRIENSVTKKLFIIPPLEGKYFRSNQQEITLDEYGRFRFNLKSKSPGFIYILSPAKNSFKYHVLFYTPNQKSKIVVDGDNILKISGDNLVENELLLTVNRYSSISRSIGDTYTLIKKYSPDSAFLLWNNLLEIDLDRFRKYYSENTCDEFFLQALIKDHKSFYINLFIYSLIRIAPIQFLHRPQSKMTDNERIEMEVFREKWGDVFQKVVTTISLQEKAFYSFDYNEFIGGFIGWYLLRFKGINQPPDYMNLPLWHYTYFPKFDKYLDNPEKEARIAGRLEESWVLGPQAYGPGYLRIFEEFKKNYPASVYLANLARMADDVSRYLNKKDLRAEIRYLDSEKYSNFDSLVQLFNGTPLYIDLWATWCKPCIEEFKYYPIAKELLDQKGVKVLYISVDDPNAEDKWKEFTGKYNLNGIHIMANQNLRRDIWKRVIIQESNIEIYPWYLLVGKNGEVLMKEAPKLSQIEKLKSALMKYLK